MRLMDYFSIFSGIGGFELGIDCAYRQRTYQRKGLLNNGNSTRPTSNKGWNKQPICIGYSEIDKYAIQIYKKHFKGHKNYGDATGIDTEELPDFDFLVGGFPCQAFSIAGKRGGFQDTRGTLFFEIARILADKRPRYFLLENVKGLLSHESGKTFQTILKVLTDLGYLLQWEVLNSKNFGVPQNRERVFIFGARGECGFQVFPIGEGNQEHSKQNVQRHDIAHTITNTDKHRGSYIIHNVYGGFKEKQPREFKDYSPTIRTPKGGGRLPMVAIVSRPHGYNKGGIKPLPCLRSCNSFDKNEMLLKNSQIRRLIPTECERLQGFPDGWTEGISDTQRYKCLGNAVTVNVIEAIITQIAFL